MRAAEVPSDLPHRSRPPVSEQIERGDLCQREFARCKLLRGGEDQLTPEAADRDDSPTDLTETLPASRHLVERALPHLAAGDADCGGEAAAQPLSGLGYLGNSVTARCMHMRIY